MGGPSRGREEASAQQDGGAEEARRAAGVQEPARHRGAVPRDLAPTDARRPSSRKSSKPRASVATAPSRSATCATRSPSSSATIPRPTSPSSRRSSPSCSRRKRASRPTRPTAPPRRYARRRATTPSGPRPPRWRRVGKRPSSQPAPPSQRPPASTPARDLRRPFVVCTTWSASAQRGGTDGAARAHPTRPRRPSRGRRRPSRTRRHWLRRARRKRRRQPRCRIASLRPSRSTPTICSESYIVGVDCLDTMFAELQRRREVPPHLSALRLVVGPHLTDPEIARIVPIAPLLPRDRQGPHDTLPARERPIERVMDRALE